MMIVAVFVAALGLYLLRAWRSGDRRHLPPGPRPWPLIGNLLALDARAPHVSLARLAERYGPVFGVQLGQVYTVVVSDGALIRGALRLDEVTGRAPLHVTHGIMGGYGLICAEGELWRDQRRLSIGWLKTLGMVKHNTDARARLLATIDASVAEALRDLRSNSGRPINPVPTLLHTMGNIMNQLVFGQRYARDDPTWLYLQHLQEEGVRHIGVSGAVNFLPWLRHLPAQRRVIAFLLDGKRCTHAIYDRIVAAMRQGDDSPTPPAPATNIIQLFLRERDHRQAAGDTERLQLCSDEQLRHLLADLFGAGVDTTLTTLRWFLLYVARDTRVQRCIRDEMSTNLTTTEHGPTYSDRDRLPYLRAAIAEAQRIRSVVPLGIPHGVRSPGLEIAGYHIPAGTMVIPLQWAVHMDERRWPEPECFRPERFLNAATGAFSVPDGGAAFIPFQSGKRMCPGEELAHMMLFTYCARIVHEFELQCAPDASVEGECGITLTPSSHEITFVSTSGDVGGWRGARCD